MSIFSANQIERIIFSNDTQTLRARLSKIGVAFTAREREMLELRLLCALSEVETAKRMRITRDRAHRIWLKISKKLQVIQELRLLFLSVDASGDLRLAKSGKPRQ